VSPHPHTPRWRYPAAAVAAAALLVTTAAGATADPDPATLPPADGLSAQLEASVRAELKVQALAGLTGPTEAFVEFTDRTTREAVAQSRGSSSQAVADSAEQQIEGTADSVVDDLGDVTVLYTATNGLAGVAVSADADALRALADRDDVVSVRPIIPKERQSNAGADVFTGSAASWQNAGITGEGQTIAVIDSGIDFTHASFNADPAYAYPTELNAETKTLLATAPTWPQGKVLGGYDFAGLNYTAAAGQDPQPDPNPLDEAPGLCGEVPPASPRSDGHGSHVAGTAAGFGVGPDGTTFEGDYTTLAQEDLLDLQVGPGSAPEADLVALKIFGCAGSSSVTGAALDWLLDPNNELAQQVTVVNMSIGSTFSTVDDPENDLIEQLVEQGVVVVTSAGNSGDTHDIGGSPGNANATLAVANSVADTFNFEGASVSVSGGAAETLPGQYSIAYLFPNGPVGPSEVVTLTPGTLAYNSGCLPYTPADVTKVAGKTVVVAWDDAVALPCGSAARANAAADAGAAGIIFTSGSEVFAAGLTGNVRIPTFQFTGPVTEELFDWSPATGVITIPAPLTITFDNALSVLSVAAPSVADTLNDSSSRGVHGSLGSSKPDVAAPGTTIASVAVGSGNGWSNKSGTSMASPHAAGVAALTREAHPDWSAAQVKAGVMNTATHDVTIGDVPFGPQRVGSGRVDAFDSVNNSVIAYDQDNPTGVSVGFGVVELEKAVAITRTIEVLNTGAAAVTLGVGYNAQTEVPGVEYVLSADEVSVPAGGTASFDVTLSVTDPAAVARTLDPSMTPTQVGAPREFLTIPQGWVELTGAPEVDLLRVPVSAAVKPTSAMAAGPVVFGSADSEYTRVGLAGRAVDQEGFLSIVAPFNLAAESGVVNPDADPSLLAADLKAVGTSQWLYDGTAPYVGFGVEMQGPWATLGASNSIVIEVETPQGTYDVVVQKYDDGVDSYDLTLVLVFDEDGENTGLEFINDVPASVDTNSYDSSVAVLPVSLDSLGYTDEQIASGDVSFDYSVSGTSWLADGGTYDTVGDLSFEWNTGLGFGDLDSAVFASLPGTSIPVTRLENLVPVAAGLGQTQKDPAGPAGVGTQERVETVPSGEKILFLHMHNAVGLQGQIVDVQNVSAQVPGDRVFTDVKQGDMFFDDITWLANQGISTGWDNGDGTYRFEPLSSINRDAMAAFLYRMAGEPDVELPETSPFSDVSTDNEFYTEIVWASQNEITTGWPDGTFRPTTPIARDAIAAFLYRYAEVDGLDLSGFQAPAESPFIDITPSSQFYREITWLESVDVIRGWDDGSFRPLDPAKRDAMAAFLYRLSTEVLS